MTKIKFFLCLSVMLVSVSVCWSQEIRGGIGGRIIDAQGKPIQGAGIVVQGSALQGIRSAVTDADGHFLVPALPVGSYEVSIQHADHHEATLQRITVRLGRQTGLGEIGLQPNVLEMPPVVVYGERPPIDPTSTTTGGNLRRVEFEQIPTDRGYRSIIKLLPQANESFFGDEINVSGATGLENMYYIDGINVTDPYRATTGTNLPYNFVKEIELKRGGYEAEYGGALGGIVNVVTGTGSNEFDGSAFGFYTSDALAGDVELGLADASIEGFATYDAGFSVSGPIIKDKLWYFLAYDRARSTRDIAIPGYGTRPDDSTMNMYAGKLTWKVNDDTDLVFTALGDPAKRDVISPYSGLSSFPVALENPDPVLGEQETGGFNFSVSARTFASSRVLVDASASIYERQENLRGATERGRTDPLFVDLTTGIWSGGYGTYGDLTSSRWTVQASATAFLGRHTLKGGILYEEVKIQRDTATTEPGNIQFDGMGYTALTFIEDSESRAELPALFLQDSWRVTNRLRVNYGLRWDGVTYFGQGGQEFQEINDQYQPRIGFTYQPGEIGTQQIFGSAGRFYQRFPMYLPATGSSAFENRLLLYDVDPRVDPDGYYAEIPFGVDDPQPWNLDLEGEYSDELALGYERRFGQRYKASVIGTYRTLGNAIRTGIPPGPIRLVLGNPGAEDLSYLPAASRDYWSLEFAVSGSGGPRLDFLASWVISRNEGNAPGLFDSDKGVAAAGNSVSLRLEEQIPNSSGLLPNDRTHVLKLSGAYRFDHGVTLGMFASWMEGTPLNEFGASSLGLGHNVFLVPRGSAGTTPSIWDFNLRLQYAPEFLASKSVAPNLVLDLLHVASQGKVVWTDQVRYLSQDNEGNQSVPNLNFGHALRYQPPMMVRLGLEISF